MVQPAAQFAGNLDVEVFGSSLKSCSTLASADVSGAQDGWFIPFRESQ